VAMNDDGEFELVLGNKQLFSVFFIVVVLLGVCFLMGYVVGKNSAPILSAAIASKGDAEPLVIPPATEPKQLPADPVPPVTETVAQTQKAAKVKDEPVAPAPPPATPEPEKAAPAAVAAATPAKTVLPGFQGEKTEKSAPKTGPKQAPLASQPIPGRVYLQLSATERDSAEGMADLLRSKKFPAIAAQVPERPALYRVLVGPLSEGDIAKTRADLKANSFPADEAVRRVF